MAEMRLLLATTNPGKVREIRLALGALDVTLVTLDEFGVVAAPDETGATFAENAALKARYYAESIGVPTVAEDSGLSIDAIDGRPGVESARYPGETYTEKFAGIYRELTPFPRPWTARFTAAVVFVDPTGARPLFEGVASVEGEIAREPRGSHGFGYDPVFFFPPYGCTTGEMTDAQKISISHRGAAFRQFSRWLKEAGASGQAR
jgi:XTP/dITP diphosphohydrolase